MNRNKQLLNRSFYPSIEEGFIEKPIVVGGKVLLERVSVSDHYSQFDVHAFSLQSINDAGLTDQLKRSPAPNADPLDVLDRFADQAGNLNFNTPSTSVVYPAPEVGTLPATDPS